VALAEVPAGKGVGASDAADTHDLTGKIVQLELLQQQRRVELQRPA
jgi:hypothetical protein